jgi:CRISPR-associated protein Csm3
LGGGGSRGSGRVRFANLKLTWRGQGYYATGAAQKDLGAGVDLASLQTGFQEAALSFLREE